MKDVIAELNAGCNYNTRIEYVLLWNDPKTKLSKMLGFTKFSRLMEFIVDEHITQYKIFS